MTASPFTVSRTGTAARIGMDIGGTKIEGISLGADGEVEARLVVPTEQGVEGVLGSAAALIGDLAERAGRDVSEFTGVGVGVPGQVDRASGVVRNAYNIGISSLAIGSELSARIGIPVAVENDVTAASIGASHLMGFGGTVAYLNLGTGLAAGIVVNGEPLRGANGFAGEVGHLAVDPLLRECLCGQRGCIETVASGSALKRFWPAAGEHPGRTLLPAVEAGDTEAERAFELLVEGSVTAIRVLGFTVNPDAIVIGGGLRLLGDPLFAAIRAQLEQLAAESEFLAALELHQRLEVLPDDSPAAAVGAALGSAE